MVVARKGIIAALAIGPALLGADRVVATPSVIEIASQERVVEYKELTLTTKDLSSFKVLGAKTQRRLVNLLGPTGLTSTTCHYLVHLASTVKPGTYEDVITFEVDDKAKPFLKVPVRIIIKPREQEPKGSAAAPGADGVAN